MIKKYQLYFLRESILFLIYVHILKWTNKKNTKRSGGVLEFPIIRKPTRKKNF